MTEFLAILAVLYTCNAAAEVRVLSSDEAVACSGVFEVVKAQFMDDPEAGNSDPMSSTRQNVDAYLAFKQWEADNPDLVDEMQRAARHELLETPA
ncbi:hypothetical protein [Tropicimonas aquimaris]|uniref:Uncharacterized protein n=1 Tax=Tropicimonas aquimaris TaxID=914152 RepID=A0ABW3INX2_9RHOB